MTDGYKQAGSPGEAAKSEKKAKAMRAAQRVFWLTLGLNLLVSFGKLFWGYHTHTLSLSADGFHSLLDGVSNVVGIAGLGFAMKPADHDHPYGHRKFEAFAAMIISFFIFLTCLEILGSVLGRLTAHDQPPPEISLASYAILVGTLGINIFVTWYERRKGRELNSELLLADAQHTLSDCMVSVSVLVSMALVQWGFLWADAMLAVVIALIILRVGYGVIMTHLGALMDEAVLDPAVVRRIVTEVPGVLACYRIRSRGMTDQIFIDLHIQVDPNLTVKQGHNIADAVEARLEKVFEGRINDVLVHVEEFES